MSRRVKGKQFHGYIAESKEVAEKLFSEQILRYILLKQTEPEVYLSKSYSFNHFVDISLNFFKEFLQYTGIKCFIDGKNTFLFSFTCPYKDGLCVVESPKFALKAYDRRGAIQHIEQNIFPVAIKKYKEREDAEELNFAKIEYYLASDEDFWKTAVRHEQATQKMFESIAQRN